MGVSGREALANEDIRAERFESKSDGSVHQNHFNASQNIEDEDLDDKPTFQFGPDDKFQTSQKLMKPSHIYYQGVNGQEKSGEI